MHCPYCKVEYTHDTPCFCQSNAKDEQVREPEEQQRQRADGARMGRSNEWYAG
jgi:hypothetical protein